MSEEKKGKLFLITSDISEDTAEYVIPEGVKSIVFSIKIFFVENLKSARRFLKRIKYPVAFEEVQFFELSEHNEQDDNYLISLLELIIQGQDAGVLSEAGSPAVADPGKNLIRLAHSKQIKIVPLVGPSSILLALMASGLNGQNFSFVGYLPKDQQERRKKIKELEQDSFRKNQTQLFIETPYRNQHLFDDLLSVCSPQTLLCIACEITSPGEFISTKQISEWNNFRPDIQKKPTVFLLLKR